MCHCALSLFMEWLGGARNLARLFESSGSIEWPPMRCNGYPPRAPYVYTYFLFIQCARLKINQNRMSGCGAPGRWAAMVNKSSFMLKCTPNFTILVKIKRTRKECIRRKVNRSDVIRSDVKSRRIMQIFSQETGTVRKFT